MRSRWSRWAILAVLAAIALAVVMIPMYLIRPFAPQTPDTMALVFRLRRWAPLISLVAVGLALLVVVRIWGSSRWVGRVLSLLLLVPSVAGAVVARKNLFEAMFAPLPDPRFVRAGEARFVAPGDMVLAVALGGDAVAYPVRQLSYHHLVQDSAGGAPIVATY